MTPLSRAGTTGPPWGAPPLVPALNTPRTRGGPHRAAPTAQQFVQESLLRTAVICSLEMRRVKRLHEVIGVGACCEPHAFGHRKDLRRSILAAESGEDISAEHLRAVQATTRRLYGPAAPLSAPQEPGIFDLGLTVVRPPPKPLKGRGRGRTKKAKSKVVSRPPPVGAAPPPPPPPLDHPQPQPRRPAASSSTSDPFAAARSSVASSVIFR